MDKFEKQLREENKNLFEKMKAITALAETEKRNLTEEEDAKHIGFSNSIEENKKRIERHNKELALEAEFESKPADVVTKVEVNNSKLETKEAMYDHTAQIFQALSMKGVDGSEKAKVIKDAQKNLFLGGHYKGFKNSVEAFNTLTDSKGGIFLPTTISDMVMDIEKQYGIFPSNSLSIPMRVGGGRQIVPNLLGEITFHAVNQGNEAKASRFTFSGIALEELKWMAFVPWTNEMGAAAGQKLVELILRKLGEASAKTKDNAVINGDGTSVYNNLVGLIDRSASADYAEVRLSTAATGNTSFATIDVNDFANAQLDIAPSLRSQGVYGLHTDWEVRLQQIVDAENRPYYLSGGPISVVNGQYRIWNKPVFFSEAVPNTDGVSKPYGFFFNPNYLAFGDVGAFSAEELTEATIQDENGNNINLGAQDMRALRIKQYFDYELSQLTVSSGGNNLGAFTVLETAAS